MHKAFKISAKYKHLVKFIFVVCREENILEVMKCRKWKKFGFYNIEVEEFQPSYDKFKLLADQVRNTRDARI